MKKTVFGKGVNDSNNIVSNCLFYRRWQSMLRRAYCETYQQQHPSYRDVVVCEEWHLFSNFKKWMIKQEWEGMELDKDILYPGNKTYSPETCVFVPKQLNRILNDRASMRGAYPQGVNLQKVDNKYRAQIRIHGKRKNLGVFDTIVEAHKIYIKEKIKYIESFFQFVNDDVKIGLTRHIEIMKQIKEIL